MTSKITNRSPGTCGGSNSKIKLALAALVFGLVMPFAARAALLTEDFNYAINSTPVTWFNSQTSLTNGLGWGTNNWQTGSGRGLSQTNQISYSSGGYATTQTTNSGTFYATFTAYRGARRLVGVPLTNVVWFSALMKVGASKQAYIGFNSGATGFGDSPSSTYSVGISNGVFVVGYGGNTSYVWPAFFTPITSGLSAGATHLVLGRISFLSSGNNSELKLWVDPADLTQLGAAQFTQSSQNIGSNLFNVCVGAAADINNGVGGLVAALRFSDGNGSSAQAYTDVTGTTNLATAPPTVTISPAVPVVGNGGNITLTGTSTATNFQWSFNGTPIADATNSTLALTGVTSASRGFYSVTVTNAAGPGSSVSSLEVTNCGLSLVWQGGAAYAGPTVWDVATTNWGLLSNPATKAAFGGDDTVIFDESASTKTVTLGDVMKPSVILFSNVSSTYVLSGDGAISGPGQLVIDSTTEVDLFVSCTYTGGTVINGGPLVRTIPGKFQADVQFQGANVVQLALQSASGVVPGNFSGTNINSHVTASSGLVGFTATLSGNLSHAGDLRVNAGTVILTGSNSYNGPTLVGNLVNPATHPKLVVGSVNAIPNETNTYHVIVNGNTFNCAGLLDLNGYSILINALDGVSGFDNGVVSNGIGTVTLTLGNNDNDGDYESDMMGGIALVKVGGGTQILGSANLSYTGTTTVSNGTLVINGTLNSSSPSVDVWGGSLGGFGSIYAPIAIHAGGTLAPGANGTIGALTVNTNVNLGGTLLLRLDNDSGSQNDRLIVADPSSTLTLGGTLTVQNVSTNSTFAIGDSFTLFTATSIIGNFSAVNLPHNYGWDTSQLANSGIITVTATNVAPPQPTILPVYLDNTRTNLAMVVGTVSGAQYVLQGTTNLNSPIIWSPVLTNTGTGGSITNLIPIAPGISQQFYRYQAQ